jgi:hypothetical protein
MGGGGGGRHIAEGSRKIVVGGGGGGLGRHITEGSRKMGRREEVMLLSTNIVFLTLLQNVWANFSGDHALVGIFFTDSLFRMHKETKYFILPYLEDH